VFCVDQVSIIGAGNVGAACASALLATQLFRKIVLMDINRQRAQGEAMDLSHAAAFFPGTQVRDGGIDDCAGSELIVFTAGAAQKPGQTRRELCAVNARILRQTLPELARSSPKAVVLIVTNPVDVMTYAAWRFCGFDPARVIGSGTVLDTARMRALLSAHTGVSPASIDAYVLGEHGDSETAVFSATRIAGMTLEAYCAACQSCRGSLGEQARGAIADEVKNAAYAIIEKKGSTAYGIAAAVARIAGAIARDEHAVLTVSAIDPAQRMAMSVPCVVGQGGVVRRIPMRMDERERAQMDASAAQIRRMIQEQDLL
jgi:L-lactate dehydrogenase